MKELILKNIEKVVLAALLVILAGCAILLIFTMDKEVINVITDRAGTMVKSTDYEAKNYSPNLLNISKTQPYDPRGYIYCRKLDCKYILIDKMTKCPVCSTPTTPFIPQDIRNKDRDKDGILDQVELTYGLNPDDASDAVLDKDGDGYSNIDEYKSNTDLSDKLSHPSILARSKLDPRLSQVEYYPILLSNLAKNHPDDKKKWDVYADVVVNGRRVSVFYRINELIAEIGYTIVDVGSEEGKDFIVILKEGEAQVKIFAGKTPTIKRRVVLINNELTNETVGVEEGKEFKLKDLSGTESSFKADKLINGKIKVIDQDKKEIIELSTSPLLNKPGAVETVNPLGPPPL